MVHHQNLVGVHDRRQAGAQSRAWCGSRRCFQVPAGSRALCESRAPTLPRRTRGWPDPSASVRAIATRCFSPPESFSPRSPTRGLIPIRQRLDEARECARRARPPSTFRVCRRPGRPYAMLYSIVSLNRTVSCGTMPIAARRLSCVSVRTSCPSIRILAGIDVVETEQQSRQRRLARPGRPDHRGRRSTRDHQAYIVQHLPSNVIRKIDVLESHFG